VNWLRLAGKRAQRVFAAALCLIGVTAPVVASADSPIIVGVLEDVKPGNLSTAMSVPHARVAFQKTGDEWVPFRTDFNTLDALAESYKYYPDTVGWTVVFDGKKIGAITSKNPGPPNSYGDVGAQTITTDRAHIPKITVGLSAFSHSDNPAQSRPLVLVSVPNYKDPDAWKPTHLSGAEQKLAIKSFRERYPSLEHCDRPEEKPIKMIPYSDGEILFLGAYRSRSGEVIFGQRLDDKRSNCGFFDDPLFFDYWFALDQAGEIRLLGSQMTPIDAVDLDNSGHSEWVFQIARGEDEDGYELFYENFARKATFHWAYH
jgi:hypothetical protein